MTQAVELNLFYQGKLVLEKSAVELKEAVGLLICDLPVEVRYGRFSLASGVRVEQGSAPGEYCFIYSNGYQKEIPAESIWKISQALKYPYGGE